MRFDTSGIMARPAGVAGLMASSGSGSAGSFSYGQALDKSTALSLHALRLASPYADVTPTGWAPREPLVQPTFIDTGAGVVSAGSIDNTYTPQPLKNKWGKARELATNEIRSYPKKQASDLLIEAKGGHCPPPPMGVHEMGSVRPMYSRTIPLFHPIDPQRCESGFVRSPNIIPGALPPPAAPFNSSTFTPKTVPGDHALRKLAYDQSMFGCLSTLVPDCLCGDNAC